MRLLAAICLLLSGCASPQWSAVMAARQNSHLFKDGECRPWAKEVQAQLPFPTRRIAWSAIGVDPFAKGARHEVLAYHVGQEVWFIDNFSAAPKWVGMEGESLEKMAAQFYSPAYVLVGNIRVDGN